ncbi:metalloregulator ArsR/SmtB family transcription factor [Fodinisporobacter ferrooxydans]|uniref:Metalloregulator ArsR/SmtB family transcription factor n=1 Tax=Fodinisporobacter ferrooxydans TaxID=2901836 RepID=A0ABY4CGB5_9BACL|nr:metalloregulator ArsR/SmtB family transcription factor [Alicyclobacillaceae bacterium MYW30-H2]
MITRMDEDCCKESIVHQEAVADCLPGQLSEPLIAGIAESFKALSDPTRIRILHNLSKRELCVCDLAEVLGMTQSAVSHQLRYLRTLRIVKSRREGNTIFYTCDDAHIVGLLQMGIDHAFHVETDKENSHGA